MTYILALGPDGQTARRLDFVPAFEVEAKTLTGAGDSWDSANIVGYLSKISPFERLMFSNAYASLYVSNSHADPPTMSETLELLKMSRG